MSEDNGRDVVAVRGDSVFADPRDRGCGAAKAEGNGPLTEASTSGREAPIPDPEVPAQAKRRRFVAAYKVRVVEEAEGLYGAGSDRRIAAA